VYLPTNRKFHLKTLIQILKNIDYLKMYLNHYRTYRIAFGRKSNFATVKIINYD